MKLNGEMQRQMGIILQRSTLEFKVLKMLGINQSVLCSIFQIGFKQLKFRKL